MRSMETVDSGTSVSVPPNQPAKRLGSVHSFQTRRRGASKTRVIFSPPPAAVAGAVWLGTSEALLALAQPRVQAAEARVPEAASRTHPVRARPLGPSPRAPTFKA